MKSRRHRGRLSEEEGNSGGPRRLGDLLPQLMAKRGYAREISHEQYAAAWEQACGSLARDSRPGLLRRGVLEVVVKNSAVLQELTFRKRTLTAALAQLLPDQSIREIRFVVGNLD